MIEGSIVKINHIMQAVGNTPAVRFATDEIKEATIWVKLEGTNPTGSVKDRACLYNIRGAEQRGQLRPGRTLLDASSGNMACALAYFGRVLNYDVKVVCSTKLTLDKAAFIEYFGATLLTVGSFTIEGNMYCRDVIQRESPDKYCFLDQLHNWDNPRAHFETTGPEIVRDFPHVQAVVGSLGSGGMMNGVGRYIKTHVPTARLITVEAAAGTKLPGTASFADGDYKTPFVMQGLQENIFDHGLKVSEADARTRTAQLAAQGIFAGFQTGGVLHAAISAIHELHIRGDVIAISGDSGWKNMSVLWPR
jgi:cysteine synthase